MATPVMKQKKEPEIRKEYKPSDTDQTVIEHVYTRLDEMSDSDERQTMEKEWDAGMKQWECYRPPKDADDWKSDIYIPLTTSIVESELAEIVNQDLKPYAVERGPEDAPKAIVMNNIYDYTWDVGKGDVNLFEILKDTIICGTGIGQEYYLKMERTITKSDGTKKNVLEYDDCYLERVSLNDFYVDENARSFTGPYGAQDAIRRYIMDYDIFKKTFTGSIWNPWGNVSKVKPGGDVNYYEWFKPPQGMDTSNQVEVLWYWNKPDDKLVIVANDVLIVNKPNPYMHKQLPFAKAIDIRRPGKFYGRGESKLLESIQEEANTLRRMIIDRNHLDIDKPIMVSDQLTIEDEDAMARPHGIIPVGDVNAAKPFEYNDIANSVFKSLEMLNDDKIRVTGMDERQQSVSTAGTATEAAILKEATLRRINMKVLQIKNDFLVDVGRLRTANVIQFYSQPKLEKIVGDKRSEEYKAKVQTAADAGQLVTKDGEDFVAKYRKIRVKDKKVTIDPKTGMVKEEPYKGFTFFDAIPRDFVPINGGFDIRYKASSAIPISKPLKQQKDLEMYDRLIQNPSVDPWKLAKMVLESGDYDPDEFKLQPKEEITKPGVDEKETLKKVVDLAGIENSEMMNGKKIGATPYAPPVHTEMHINFMRSDEFKDNTPEGSKVLDIFVAHVTGELMAQQARGMSGEEIPAEETPQEGLPGISPAPASQGGTNNAMAAAMPGRSQGGGQMPSGMRGSETGIQVGR